MTSIWVIKGSLGRSWLLFVHFDPLGRPSHFDECSFCKTFGDDACHLQGGPLPVISSFLLDL